MKVRIFSLRFNGEDTELESSFRRHYALGSISHFRFCCMIAILFLTTWIYLDYTFYPAQFMNFVIMKLLNIPFFLLGFIFSYKKSFALKRELVSLAFVILVGSNFILMMAQAQSLVLYPLLLGLMITLIFNYAFIRIRFLATAAGGAFLFVFLSFVLFFFRNDLPDITVNTYLYIFFLFNLLGLFISYTTERSYRREFYLLSKLYTDKERIINNMENRLNKDDLTGFYNRTVLTEVLYRKIESACKMGVISTLVYINLDHIKSVNDSLGHQTGDLYISLLGTAVRRTIREDDMALRLGGDEFVLFLNACDKGASIIERIEELYKNMCRKRIMGLQGSFSYGLVSIDSFTICKPEQLLSRAESLMREHKKGKMKNEFSMHFDNTNSDKKPANE